MGRERKTLKVLDPYVLHATRSLFLGKMLPLVVIYVPNGFTGSVSNLSEIQIDVLRSILACRMFCVACVPKISRRIGKGIPVESSVELHHIEKKISTVETYLEKIETIPKSPPFYAEKVKFNCDTNATMFHIYPQEHVCSSLVTFLVCSAQACSRRK